MPAVDSLSPAAPAALSPEAVSQAHLSAALARGQAEALAAARQLSGPHGVAVTEGDGRRGMIVVDRFARHTMCFRVDNGRLRHAARATDLADGETIDPQALFHYFYFHCIPSPRTVFQGVHRVPPGHALWFDDGRWELHRLWKPRLDEPAATTAPAALRAEFMALLEQAVRRQLDGSMPACFLSGGTDSSTVAGLAARLSGRGVDSYSIGFEAEGYDEMAYARLAARHFGTRHHEYYVTPDDLVAGIPAVAAHHDQPFGNSSALPAYYCALKARQDGVSKLLAGDGGDELFGGNTRYAKQRVFHLYQSVPPGMRQALLEPLSGQAWPRRVPGLRKAMSYVEQARVPMPDRMQTYNLLHRIGIERVFAAGFRSAVQLDGPLRHEREVWSQSEGAGLVNRMLAFDWRYTLAENDLVKVRGSTSLAGVDVGYPLLDDDLADFSLRLPSSYKLKGLTLRWFFKDALRGFLPPEIIAKKKHGFGLPFGVWLARHAPLQKMVQDAIDSFSVRGVIEPRFGRMLVDELLPQHPGYYGEMAWLLVTLEHWLRRHAPDWRLGR